MRRATRRAGRLPSLAVAALALVLTALPALNAAAQQQPAQQQQDGLLPDLDIEIIRKLDLNGDGKINPGRETRLLGTFFNQLSTVQKGHYHNLTLSDDPAGGVPVDEFSTARWFERMSTTCRPEQRVYLRDKVINISLLQPGLKRAGGDHATVSATRTAADDIWTWKLDGAVTGVPFWNPCFDGSYRFFDGTILSGAALAAYADFVGQGTSVAKGTSSLDLGLNTEFQLFGGPLFDLQQINFRPFYRTDFEFDAEIYGFSASWLPFRNDFALGGYVGTKRNPHFWWTLGAEADFLSVAEAGRTKLKDGTEYGWLVVNTAAHFEFDLRNQATTMFADVGYHWQYDVINGHDAPLFDAKAGFYLDPGKNATINVNYLNGTIRNTLAEVDQVTINFGLKF